MQMKRGERIYAYIREKSESWPGDRFRGRIGFDAQEIAEALDMLRNNVSKELNALHRQGKIVKFSGRPVLYFDKACLEAALGVTLGEGACRIDDVESVCQSKQSPEAENPFVHLIGAQGSLKRQVEQAKAAILYPPDGLHTLIVGQTGVGKTLFAHMMFEYGKVMHRFAEEAPFVTFNCADYYNNPQLLISHIFGYVKGAFTGAEQSKAGLVEEADGGVLFLDEIHRLPPEGQEMIFYFMDTGTFNRLGETQRSRRAKVLIIGATTEDPESALTKTFVRRIPNIMKIPPLAERSTDEKLDIIKLMFQDEAQRVKKPIRVGVETIKALVGSIGSGNAGQLKSNIKLLCAQAFLNGIDSPEGIEVDFKMLPQQIRSGLLTLSANRQALTEVTKALGSDSCIIVPPGPDFLLTDGVSGAEFNLYQVVEAKVELLKGEGISSDLIKQILAADVNVYVRNLYNKKASVNMTTRERLLKIVDASLVDFAEQVALYVQKRMNASYHDRFLYAFSLHLSAFLKRVKSKDAAHKELEGTVPQDSLCLEVATEIGSLIGKHYRIEVPRVEIEYIALLLESSQEDDRDDRVVLVVATHGQSTATSMVEVAQRLFGTTDVSVLAVDMPLEVRPQAVLDKMAAMLQSVPCLKGVLILADMGSLCNLGPSLEKRLDVPVRTIDMVSTPLILEAMRKAELTGMDLDGLYDSLASFHGYEARDVTQDTELEKVTDDGRVVVTICSTGQGTALKLKSLVEEILRGAGQPLPVIPVGIVKLEEHLREIAEGHRIVAAVGVKKPAMRIPFISLEAIIDGEGEAALLELVTGSRSASPHRQGSRVVQSLCSESLCKFLTYLNPEKVMPLLMEFDERLEAGRREPLANPLRIRLLVHCGCALERCVMRKPLHYGGNPSELRTEKVEALKEAAEVFSEKLHLTLAADEYYFMAEMI